MEYISTADKRRTLAKRLAKLAGEKAVYTGMPECAFLIGDFRVEKDGMLTIGPEADETILPTLLAEGLITEYEPEQKDVTEEDREEPTDPSLTFPLKHHTISSLRNLIRMVCAKGDLISKATGGHFYCAEVLAEALEKAYDMNTFREVINHFPNSLVGLRITDDSVVFTGFPDDEEHMAAYTNLAMLMNRYARKANHIRINPVPDENERYNFRVWLLLLGMKGKEFAETRKVLLKPLTGDTAFKDKDMENRWREKHRVSSACPAI